MNCHDTEILLSGFVDGELIQGDRQKVELHLESCENCRRVLEDLRHVKKAARRIPIEEPTKEEWKKMEQRIFERSTRSLGWLILVVWSAVTAGYAAYSYAFSPTESLFHKILVFGIFLGLGLLFLSVLLERVRESRTDRYKGVLK